MMTESSKAINVFSNSTSSSRLSPLARPFMIKNPYSRHGFVHPLLDASSSSSTFSFDQSLSYLSLGGQGHRSCYSVQSDATSITAFPCVDDFDVELNSRFTCYPLEESSLHTHLSLPNLQNCQSSCISRSSSLGNVGHKSEHEASENRQGREILHNNNYIGGVSSLSCNNLLEQGTTVEGSKLVSDTRPVVHGKVTLASGKGNRVRPEEVHTEGRNFPLANSALNLLNEYVMEPFSTSSDFFQDTLSLLPYSTSLVPLDNVACRGTNAVSNKDTFIKQNVAYTVACNDQVIIEKGENIKIFAPDHYETKNPSIREKTKLQTACVNVPEDLTMEQCGAKPGILDDKSSANHDDSDVDSPCWKGIQSYKSPFRDLVPVNSEHKNDQSTSKISVPLRLEHSKEGTLARNSLNPLAPVFIPGNSKQKMDHTQKECHEDSLLSSQMLAALAVTCSTVKDRLMDSVREGMCPSERVNDAGIQCPNDIYDSKKENGIPSNSVFNSSCSFQSYSGKQNVTLVTSETFNVLDGVEDIAHNEPNSSCTLLTGIALNSCSYSIGADVFPDFTERLQDPSKSTPPKINVKLMINTLQCLSELLVQNSSFDFGSLTEHEYDKLLKTINNLYVIVQSKAGKLAAGSESSYPRTLYSHRQPAHHYEEMDKTSNPMLCCGMLYSFNESNHEDFKKGYE